MTISIICDKNGTKGAFRCGNSLDSLDAESANQLALKNHHSWIDMSSFASIHLTEKGYQRAVHLFDSVAGRDALRQIASSSPSEPDWADFDSVYLYLYRLTLLRLHGEKQTHAERVAKLPHHERSTIPVIKVEHLLDVELAERESPRHLLSEFAVHSLMNFRNVFKMTIELDAEVSTVDIGCVMLIFDVRPPMRIDGGDRKTTMFTREDAKRFVERRLSTEHWRDITHRFFVKHQWIDGSLTF